MLHTRKVQCLVHIHGLKDFLLGESESSIAHRPDRPSRFILVATCVIEKSVFRSKEEKACSHLDAVLIEHDIGVGIGRARWAERRAAQFVGYWRGVQEAGEAAVA